MDHQIITLSKDLPIPLYHQLKTLLLGKIQAGEMKPNDRLPAEDELAATHGVSKATVRQALNELASAGVVRREQGRGTFVAEPRMAQGPRELTSFSAEMRRRGQAPTSRVLKQDVVKAEADVAAKLQIAEGSLVVRLKRLRLADGEPLGIQTAYLPLELAPRLAKEDFTSASLYEVLERKYGLLPARAQETHYAVLLERDEARLLKVTAGSPALSAERVTFLAGGRPLELTYSIMRGDRYKIVLDLTKYQLRA
ncbi:MAG TPA: GntR family transcriptional regulator [Blastocatellia bacterium]|nr:GntR family transcriptional regulator [Blastocatellia bacterium]